MKNGIYLREGYRAPLEMLSDAERGQLLLCLFDIAKTGACDSERLSSDGKLALAFIAEAIRCDREDYTAKCDANRRNAAKRWQGRETKTPEG